MYHALFTSKLIALLVYNIRFFNGSLKRHKNKKEREAPISMVRLISPTNVSTLVIKLEVCVSFKN